jgi:hypothetical protein
LDQRIAVDLGNYQRKHFVFIFGDAVIDCIRKHVEPGTKFIVVFGEHLKLLERPCKLTVTFYRIASKLPQLSIAVGEQVRIKDLFLDKRMERERSADIVERVLIVAFVFFGTSQKVLELIVIGL